VKKYIEKIFFYSKHGASLGFNSAMLTNRVVCRTLGDNLEKMFFPSFSEPFLSAREQPASPSPTHLEIL